MAKGRLDGQSRWIFLGGGEGRGRASVWGVFPE